jgi:hypothetical protein
MERRGSGKITIAAEIVHNRHVHLPGLSDAL